MNVAFTIHRLILLIGALILAALWIPTSAQTVTPAEKTTNSLRQFIRDNAIGQLNFSPDEERFIFVDGEKLFPWDLPTIDSGAYSYYSQPCKACLDVVSPGLKYYADILAPFTPWPSGQKKGKEQKYNVRIKSMQMVKAQYSWQPTVQYELVESLYPLAIRDDGKIITADIDLDTKKDKYDNKSSTLKSAKNLYIGDPATGERKLVYSGLIKSPDTKPLWKLTPNGNNFILFTFPVISIINLTTGTRMEYSFPDPQEYYINKFVTVTDNEILFDRDFANGTRKVWWLNISTGQFTSSLMVTSKQQMQMRGQEGWSYNEDAAIWNI